jgi:hypothetical protein
MYAGHKALISDIRRICKRSRKNVVKNFKTFFYTYKGQ